MPPVLPPFSTVAAENLGYSRYDFLVRDQRAHAKDSGEADGVLTQDELRTSIQLDLAAYQAHADSYVKIRADKSRRILATMQSEGVDAVDYLPKSLRDLPANLRVRAAELLAIAHSIAEGVIDQGVLDYARRQYETKLSRGEILAPTRDEALRQIVSIAAHLRGKGEALV